uniref:ATP synthase F0 subunit 8 n=1 Tax=Ampittia trimacula TaxID=2573047 RepID=UPI0030FF177E
MPQMMPINWIISLFFFIVIFIIFNMMNYYIFIIKSNKTNSKIFNNLKYKLTWKW